MFGGSTDGFRIAQQQKPSIAQSIMKQRHYGAVKGRAKVYKHVATAYKIKVRERRVDQHVMARKNAHVPNRFVDLEVAIDLRKKAAQPFGRNILLDVGRVDASAGFFDSRIA